MDWTSVVEWNAKRLQRILAALVAMAGLTISQSPTAGLATGESPPLRGRCRLRRQRGVTGRGIL